MRPESGVSDPVPGGHGEGLRADRSCVYIAAVGHRPDARIHARTAMRVCRDRAPPSVLFGGQLRWFRRFAAWPPRRRISPAHLDVRESGFRVFDSPPILGHIVYRMVGTLVLIRGDFCGLRSNARSSAPRCPSPRPATHFVRTLAVGGPLRGGRSFTLYSFLAALYLVVALSVPGAFLIAKQASVGSSNPLILAAECCSEEKRSSSDQFGKNAGEDGEQGSWPGPKRLRGTLLSKIGVDEILSSQIAPIAGSMALLDYAERKPVPSGEPQLPKDDLFAHESLGRPPPSGR